MSKLDELIQELCPDGVEYKRLEECCEILDRKRKPVTKSGRVQGEYPYYGANGIQDYVSDYIFDGKFILVGEDGSVITSKGKPVVNWAEGKIWVNNHAHIISQKNGVLLRFLYHFIQTIDINIYVHGNIPKFTGGDFKSLSIPVPPLAIQEEIVRILDKFTALTAELKAELKLRKKQYEYYRDALLTFEEGKEKTEKINNLIQELCPDGVEYKTLGEVANYAKQRINALNINAESYVGVENLLQNKQGKTTANSYPKIGNVIEFKKGDILIGNIRPYLKKIWLADSYGGTNGDVLTIQIKNKEKITSEFLYYILSSDDFFYYDNKHAKGGKMPRGDKTAVMEYIIPVPPLPIQEEIVRILDKFDTLCNDLSKGLPREIELRQKQYEYYRDKLLTFKVKER